MRLLRVGQDSLLAEVGSVQEATTLYAAARAALIEAREIVPAARTVLFDGIGEEGAAWVKSLADAPDGRSWARESPAQPVSTVTIPTVYDGPDLGETAELLELSAGELIELHTSTTFTVAFCGFAPGFAYCSGMGRDVPRLRSPRSRVEPGSVGLAGEFTGVYPQASPGGWRLIGHTDVVLWDAMAAVPALLAPGTRVRFEAR